MACTNGSSAPGAIPDADASAQLTSPPETNELMALTAIGPDRYRLTSSVEGLLDPCMAIYEWDGSDWAIAGGIAPPISRESTAWFMTDDDRTSIIEQHGEVTFACTDDEREMTPTEFTLVDFPVGWYRACYLRRNVCSNAIKVIDQ